KPLLHTWSLAVEEQFYFVFPPVLMLMLRLTPRRWRAVVVVLFGASFAWSVRQVIVDPTAAFYLPFARAWELLLGSLLALSIVPVSERRGVNEAAGIAGIGLIAWSVSTYSADTPFPGIHALLPCAGAALIIHSGARESTLVSKILSARVPVFV